MTTSLHKKSVQLPDCPAASMNDGAKAKAWPGSSLHSARPLHS
ncbi:hypothetical protein ACSFA5_31295 [Variovorax sp. GB4P3]